MSQPKRIEREINLDKITPFLQNPADPHNQEMLLGELLDMIFSLEDGGLDKDEIGQYIELKFKPLLLQVNVTQGAIEYLETFISFSEIFMSPKYVNSGESAYMMLLSMFLQPILKKEGEPNEGNKILIPAVKEFVLEKIHNRNLQKFKKYIVELKKNMAEKDVDIDLNELLDILNILADQNPEPELAILLNRLLVDIEKIKYGDLELEEFLNSLPLKLKGIFDVVNNKSVNKDHNARLFKDLLFGMNDCLKTQSQDYIKAITIIAQFCNFIGDSKALEDKDQQKAVVDNAKRIGLGEKIKSIINGLLALLPSRHVQASSETNINYLKFSIN